MRTILSVVLLLLAGCGSHIVGDECRSDRDCHMDAFCHDRICTIRCDDDRDCPLNAVCIDEAKGICLEECRDDRDCRRDLECREKKRESGGGQIPVCI